MNPAVTNTAFTNPTQTQMNYTVQPGGDGQLQTVVVSSPPAPGDIHVTTVVQDDLAVEIQKTTNCAWATLGSCFWPISIVAIVYTCKAKDALKAGNRAEAERYDSVATKISWASCLIGMVLWIIGISVYIYFQTAY